MKQTSEPIPVSPQFPTIIEMAAFAILAVIIVVVLRFLADVLEPFFIALFFVYMGKPLTHKLRQKKIPMGVLKIAWMVVGLTFFILCGWGLQTTVQSLMDRSDTYAQQVSALSATTLSGIAHYLPHVATEIRGMFSKRSISLARVEDPLSAMLGNIFGFLAALTMVVFYLLFLEEENVSLPRRLQKAFGPAKAETIMTINHNVAVGISHYIILKTLISALVGAMGTGILLFFHVDLAPAWGVIMFFANFIPYVGPALSSFFPAVICLLQFGSVERFLALSLALLAMHVCIGNYIEPKYASRQLNLSPLATIVSMAFWGWLWKGVGLLLSIPIMMSVKIAMEQIPSMQPWAILLSEHVHRSEERSHAHQ